MQPTVLKREDHPVSRDHFNDEARKVLYRLKNKGFIGYLAGGCVRDILLGKNPKDFDVVTDATPQQLKRIFNNCRIIGRRFRLAHIHFVSGEIIEVATFRAPPSEEMDVSEKDLKKEGGLIVRDNVFGTPEQDALRRDFTINALYYNIDDFSIIDYASGLQDIQDKLVRYIGIPDERNLEDPVRMLRAIRFAAALGLEIEQESWESIKRNRSQLALASRARLFEELQKFLYSGGAQRGMQLLQETELLPILLPQWAKWYNNVAGEKAKRWVDDALIQLDEWRAQQKTSYPSLNLSLLFHPFHEHLAKKELEQGVTYSNAIANAISQHQRDLSDRLLISQAHMHRLMHVAQSIGQFPKKSKKWSYHMEAKGEFYNAFEFYKFRANFFGEDTEVIDWWEENLPKRTDHAQIQKRPHKSRRRRKPHGNERVRASSDRST